MPRVTRGQMPWPLRSVVAGSCGTAVFTLGYVIERCVRHAARSDALDFDDSDVPGKIVASILRLGALTERGDRELGTVLRWSYGSAFGMWHGLLRRRMSEPQATIVFEATLMTATATLFPLLGKTPPPWRWPPGYLGVCVVTHTAYAATVGFVDDALRGMD